MEQACFTLNRSDLDSLNLSNSLRFLPKNQKRTTSFFHEFTEARNQLLLSESPAKLLFQRTGDDNRDLLYHVFSRVQFEAWNQNSQSPVAIVYVEEDEEVQFEAYMGLLSEYAAVAIIQGRQQTYRFCIRTRSTHFSKTEMTESHLQTLPVFIGNLKRSGK